MEIVFDGGEEAFVDGDDSFLAALTPDREVLAREMEVLYAQGAHLGDAEASIGHEGEAEAVAVLPDGAEKAADFVLGEKMGEFFNWFLHLFLLKNALEIERI
jgi:hypothetical protein